MFSSKIYESWRSLQYEKFSFLVKHYPQFFTGTILDLACGNNFLKHYFKSKNVNINIISSDIVLNAKHSHNLHEPLVQCNISGGDVVADGANLPFPSESFEKIISIDALHLFRPDLRVLKKGGLILASIFFNDDNFEERKSLLYSRLEGLFVTNELIFKGQEKELFVLARSI